MFQRKNCEIYHFLHLILNVRAFIFDLSKQNTNAYFIILIAPSYKWIFPYIIFFSAPFLEFL